MKIIVPMAGRGSRLRPHTLTVPKPLIPIAVKNLANHGKGLTKSRYEQIDKV